MEGYWLLGVLLSLWLVVDGWLRGLRWLLVVWVPLHLLFWPLTVPLYLAVRPLRAGEVREGGRAWNVLRMFALLWTILIIVAGIQGLMAVSSQPPALTETERAGRGIGVVLGLGLLGGLWFLPMVGALVLGFFLKNASVVERGPTGRLAQLPTHESER